MVNDSTSFVLSYLQMFFDKLRLICERRTFSTSPDLSQNEQRDVTGWERIKMGAFAEHFYGSARKCWNFSKVKNNETKGN